MKRNKLKALGLIAVMSVSLLAGCGDKEQSLNQGTVSVEESDTNEEMAEADQEELTIIEVTAIDGNTITGNIGEITVQEMTSGEKPDGEPPSGEAPSMEKPEGDNADGEAPSMEKPEGDNADGEAPSMEKPEGDNADGEAPSMEKTEDDNADGEAPSMEKPDGEKSDGDMPQNTPQRSEFTASGESITITVTDNTDIMVEFLQGSDTGTIDDITVGSVLGVRLDADQNAEEIIVKNLNAGGGFGGSDEVTNGTAANTIDTDSTVSDTTYTSEGDDENALRVDGVKAEFEGITVEKTKGESSNTENGDFYGQNAGLLALNGAQVTIKNATVNTSAVNGNGVFSYGEGTTVNISDSTIRTTENNSGGIQTTGGGTMIATNLDVETQGNSAAAIRSDRGGGTVNVNGGTYVTNGTGSPAVYCTADIVVEDAELQANASEGVVVEGKNSVSLVNCNLTSEMQNTYNGDSDENIHGIMIYQSMSGDAAMGEADFSAEGGSITIKSGDFIYVTNTDCTINLTDVDCTLANDTFLRVEGNSSSRGWGTEGANGGDVIMNVAKQQINGNIIVDDISSLKLSLTEKSTFTGTVNADAQAGEVNVVLSADSSWELTGDSYITSFDGDVTNIIGNGYHVYVNGEAIND